MLSGGHWFIGLEESESGLLGLGLSNGIVEAENSWIWENGNWSTFSNIPLYATLMIRANFGPASNFVSLDEALNDSFLEVYPNPFTDLIQLNSSQIITRIEVIDLLGKTTVSLNPEKKKMRLDTQN